MEFRERRPIYSQIADYVHEGILRGLWREGDRIPSIREMAVETEVNPNTVTRTYGLLQEEGVIQNQRGLGYFIARDAEDRTRDIMKEEFIRNELPYFFRKMEILSMSLGDLGELYNEQHKGGLK